MTVLAFINVRIHVGNWLTTLNDLIFLILHRVTTPITNIRSFLYPAHQFLYIYMLSLHLCFLNLTPLNLDGLPLIPQLFLHPFNPLPLSLCLLLSLPQLALHYLQTDLYIWNLSLTAPLLSHLLSLSLYLTLSLSDWLLPFRQLTLFFLELLASCIPLVPLLIERLTPALESLLDKVQLALSHTELCILLIEESLVGP